MTASNGHTPKETAKALAAYREYELMGPDRSLAKVRQKYGKSSAKLRLLERWSSAHHWQDRVRAYDEEQAKIKQQKRQAELDAMDDLHASLGRTLLLRAIRLIERHIEEGDTTFSAAIQLLKVAANLERVARGAAIGFEAPLQTKRLAGEVSVPPKEYILCDDWRPDQDGRDP